MPLSAEEFEKLRKRNTGLAGQVSVRQTPTVGPRVSSPIPGLGQPSQTVTGGSSRSDLISTLKALGQEERDRSIGSRLARGAFAPLVSAYDYLLRPGAAAASDIGRKYEEVAPEPLKSVTGRIGTVGGKALDLLGQEESTAYLTRQLIRKARDEKDSDISFQGLRDAYKNDENFGRVIREEILDNKDLSKGARTATALGGLAADILLDPLTYLSFGTGAVAKGVTKGGKALLGAERAARVADVGTEVVSKARKTLGVDKVLNTPAYSRVRFAFSNRAPRLGQKGENVLETARLETVRQGSAQADVSGRQAAEGVARLGLDDATRNTVDDVSEGLKVVDDIDNIDAKRAIENLELRSYTNARNIEQIRPEIGEQLTGFRVANPEKLAGVKNKLPEDFTQAVSEKQREIATELGLTNKAAVEKVEGAAVRRALDDLDEAGIKKLGLSDDELETLAGTVRGVKKVHAADTEIARRFSQEAENIARAFDIPEEVVQNVIKKEVTPSKILRGANSVDDVAVNVRNAFDNNAVKFSIDEETLAAKIAEVTRSMNELAAKKGLKQDVRPLYIAPRIFTEPEFGKQRVLLRDRLLSRDAEKQAQDNLRSTSKVEEVADLASTNDSFKYRQWMTREQKEKLGGVVPLEYRVQKGLSEQQKFLAQQRFYNQVAKTPYAKAVAKGEDAPEYFTELRGKEYGDLNGMHVPHLLKDWLDTQRKVIDTRKGGETRAAFEWATSRFKEGKVVLSPAAIMRDAMSNQILLFLTEPTSIFRLPKAAREVARGRKAERTLEKSLKKGDELKPAAQEFLEGSNEYMQAKRAGLFNSNYSRAEIMELANPYYNLVGVRDLEKLPKSTVWRDNLVKPAAKLRAFSEDMAKFQMYLYKKSRGSTHNEAVRAANTALFDYGDLAPFEKAYMRRFMAFYTFTRKSVPLVLATAQKHPERIAFFDKLGKEVEGITENDPVLDESKMPPWARDLIRLPIEDVTGKYRYLDLQYIYPWGNMFDANTNELGLPLFGGVNPVLSEAIQQLTNEDFFLNEKIVGPENVGGSPIDNILARAGHIADTFSPAPVRTITDKVIPQIEGAEKSKTGQDLKVSDTLLSDVLGVKFRTFDQEGLERSYDFKKRQVLSNLNSELNRVERDGTLSDDEKERKKRRLETRISQVEEDRVDVLKMYDAGQ